MTLALSNITCARGGRVLFQDVTLRVGAGEALLVRGANGSGKSSLLRLIAGLLRPAAGRVEWTSSGRADSDEDMPIQMQLHYLGHLDALKPTLSVAEMLVFWSAILSGNQIDAAIKTWRLERLADLPCGILSAGQRRRVSLAQLSLTTRPLWLLDEPTGPLDQAGVDLVADAIRSHCAGGGTAIIATHRPLEVGDARTFEIGGVTA